MNSVDKLQNYQVVTDIGALNDLKNVAKQDPKEALRPVAEQFEAIFVQQILKESRNVQLDDGWLDGGQSDFYKSWHDDQLSQSISAKGSLGLADTIVEQLAPKSLPMSQSELEAFIKKQQDRQAAAYASPEKTSEASEAPMSTQNALLLRGVK